MTNPVSGGFQFTPATGINDTATYPTTPASEAAARQQFMDLYWQLMNEMNNPTLSAAAYHSFSRQALINGGLEVWQIGTSFTNPANNAYTADGWLNSFVNTGVLPTSIVHSQVALTPGELFGSKYAYNLSINGAGSGFGTNDFYVQQQRIEFGTSKLCGAGKKISVSLYAKSNIAGKRFAVSLQQTYGSGGAPSANETCIPTATTIRTLTSGMVLYTFTFTTNTLVGKTFGTNNDDFLALNIWEMWSAVNATSLLGGGTAETFGGSGNFTFTEVQLNAGDVALPFQPKSFADELQVCQRYYEKSYSYATAPLTVTVLSGIEYKIIPSNTVPNFQAYGKTSFKVKKRVTPTMTIYPYTTPSNTGRVSDANGTDLAAGSGGIQSSGDDGFVVNNNSGGSVAAVANAVIFHWAADSRM